MRDFKGFFLGVAAAAALAYGGYRGAQGIMPVLLTSGGLSVGPGNRLPVNDMTSFATMGTTTSPQSVSSTWTTLSEGTYGGSWLAGYVVWNSGAPGNSDALIGTTSGSPIFDCPPGTHTYIPYAGSQTLYVGCLSSGQTTSITVTPVGY